MGRPRKIGQAYVYRLTLRLWAGEDDDLIDFLQAFQAGQRVAALKVALRGGQLLAPGVDDLPDEDDLDDLLDLLLL